MRPSPGCSRSSLVARRAPNVGCWLRTLATAFRGEADIASALHQSHVVPVRVMDRIGNGAGSALLAGTDWIAVQDVRQAVVTLSLGSSAFLALDAAISSSCAQRAEHALATLS